MRQIRESQITAAVMIALFLAGAARAQERQTPGAGDESAPKAEVSAQYSKIRFGDAEPSPAFAGFVTFNLTGHLAVDASAYFFPFKLSEDYLVGGRPFQVQAGIRAGKRFRRFGLFVKAQPGFVTFGETVTPELGQSFIGVDGRPFFPIDFITERKTHFSLDLGGVVEYYASRRLFARFDAGDTLIRFGRHDEAITFEPLPVPVLTVPARTHLFPQLGAGVGLRLGARAGGDDRAATSAAKGGGRRDEPTRFEAGALLTALSFSTVRQLSALPLVLEPTMTMTEFGFGGRFTYNLNRAVAIEAETSFLPQDRFLAAGVSGRVTQGQFGVKAGRRFGSFGLFAKARPGFVGFGDSLKLLRTIPFTIDGHQHFTGVFEEGRRTFFSADVGGAFELYAMRRWMLRFDAGDTVIHYGARSIEDIEAGAVRTRSPETHHNFQFSSGVSFRF